VFQRQTQLRGLSATTALIVLENRTSLSETKYFMSTYASGGKFRYIWRSRSFCGLICCYENTQTQRQKHKPRLLLLLCWYAVYAAAAARYWGCQCAAAIEYMHEGHCGRLSALSLRSKLAAC